MRLIEHEKWIRIRLDLREWWEKVEDANEAQRKLLAWDKGDFWWYDKTKEHVITLKHWKMTPYKLANTILLLPTSVDKRLGAIKKTAEDLDIVLRLDFKNKVENWNDASERAELWEKSVFWLITPDKKTIATLDFSKGGRPIITEYPRDKTNVRYRAAV